MRCHMVRACLTAAVSLWLPVAPAAEPHGTLRIATPIIAPQLSNPYPGLSLPSTIAVIPVFDPLVVIDGEGRVRPWLALSWVSQDARTWIIALRPGVTFSNGAPLTADALVASAAYLQTPKGATTTTGSTFANLDRVAATGSLTAEIHLKQPDPLFPQRLAAWKLPEPKTWALSVDVDGDGRGIGSGPFVMAEASPSRVVMMANSRSWNQPRSAKLEIHLLPEQMTRMQALAAGTIDIAMQIGPGDREELQALGGRPLNRRTYRVSYVSFAKEHAPNSPIADTRVRLALNYAINRQAIAEKILGGTVTPVGQLVLPGAPGYVTGLGSFPYDPAKARALLAAAGYDKGLALTVRVAPGGADEATFYQRIAQDLAAVNVKLTIVPAAMTEMSRMMFQGDFKADMFANFGRGLDGLGDYRYRSCLGQAGIYKPYFCDPVSLGYVRQAQAATEAAEVDRLMQVVTRREYDNPPGIFLWQNNFIDGAGPRVAEAPDYDAYYDYIPLHRISLKN